jgi:hypothetical protein
MSTRFRPYYPIFTATALILHFFTNTHAQDYEATIEIRQEKPSVAHVTGRFLDAGSAHRNLSFVRNYAGFTNLGERVKDVELKRKDGNVVSYQTATPGEFVADAPFESWSYSIDLAPQKEPAAAAHVSWITTGTGLLMLGDILPLSRAAGASISAKVTISIPEGWQQLENRTERVIETKDVDSEVVPVGIGVKYRTVRVGGTAISVGTSGDWLFTNDELVGFSQQIYEQLTTTFGSKANDTAAVNVFRFPQNVAPGQWQAETRGNTVIIISSDMPFKTQSLQRMHEQLRHEMFHLWIPNGVNLSGDYAWFYEGFALYSSLKLALAQRRIRFEDFLDTLSRAQAIDSRQLNRLSLIDASTNRWNGSETYIYARGMIVAFLCDILLLNGSKAERSTDGLLREIFAKHKFPENRTDGTGAVLTILNARPELGPVIEKYIKGSNKFEWQAELDLAGLEFANGLRVQPKLNGKQKDLLDALGYNNWRRLSQNK